MKEVVDRLYNQILDNQNLSTMPAYTPDNIKPLTLEDLKKAASKIKVGSTGTGKKKGWFERLMNRWGWYRSSEWYILRTDQFTTWPYLNKEITIKPPE